MDRMDRMLHALPSEEPSPALAAAILAAVYRRHRRRQALRRSTALVLGLLGLWLVWPGIAALSSSELFASGAPWLMGALNYVNYESFDMVSHLWNSIYSAEGALSASVALSVWIGVFLVCGAIFLAVDGRAWQSTAGGARGGSSTMLATSLHG